MFLYGITQVPLTEKIRDVDPTLLSPFYADDTAFDGQVRRSATELRLLMDRGTDQEYFHEPSKSLLIAHNLEEKEVERRRGGN